MPLAHIPPMMPRLVDAPPKGDGWLHEIKYDGYRTQIIVDGGRARAFTRNGHDWTDKYQSLIGVAETLPCTSAIIDGEMAVQNEAGVTDFGTLRSAIFSAPHRLVFFAFDLLHLNDEDLREMRLEDRRDLLCHLIEDREGIVFSQSFDGAGDEFFRVVGAAGLEGMVSKRKGSRYVSGDVDTWLKTKCWASDVFDVVGIDKGDDGLPYALLARDGVYVGSAIVTLPGGLRDAFWHYVEERATTTPPVKLKKRGVQWVKPGMMASVRYLKGSDKLRHATITGIEVAQD